MVKSKLTVLFSSSPYNLRPLTSDVRLKWGVTISPLKVLTSLPRSSINKNQILTWWMWGYQGTLTCLWQLEDVKSAWKFWDCYANEFSYCWRKLLISYSWAQMEVQTWVYGMTLKDVELNDMQLLDTFIKIFWYQVHKPFEFSLLFWSTKKP